MGSENGTPEDDEIARLRHERGMLAEALGKLLVSLGHVRPGVPMNGPELLMHADDAAMLAERERQASSTDGAAMPRVYVSVERGIPDIYVDGQVSLIVADFDREGEPDMEEEQIAALFTPDVRAGSPEEFDMVVAQGRASFTREFGTEDSPGLAP